MKWGLLLLLPLSLSSTLLLRPPPLYLLVAGGAAYSAVLSSGGGREAEVESGTMSVCRLPSSFHSASPWDRVSQQPSSSSSPHFHFHFPLPPREQRGPSPPSQRSAGTTEQSPILFPLLLRVLHLHFSFSPFLALALPHPKWLLPPYSLLRKFSLFFHLPLLPLLLLLSSAPSSSPVSPGDTNTHTLTPPCD